MVFSRVLALALSFSITFAPLAGQAGGSKLYLCRFVLDGPQAKISKEHVELRDEVAAKTLELNDELQVHWDKEQVEIMRSAQFANSLYSALTARFVRLSKHTYPFVDLQSGIPQRVRLWVKSSGSQKSEIDNEIRGWFDRYREYPKNRRTIIERMAAVQIEEKLLTAAKEKGKFPIDLEVPMALDNGQINFESRHYSDLKAIARDLSTLRESEGAVNDTFWLRHFARRRSLETRDREQATLHRRLEIVKAELTKLNSGLGNAERRAGVLKEIDTLLNDDDLLPAPYAIYLETRSAFFRETTYWIGVNQKYDEKATEANSELAKNRDFTLGTDQGQVGFLRKGLRMLMLTIPVQVPAIVLAWALPAANHQFDIYVQPSYYIKTIVEQPDDTYLKNARDFMNDRYSIRIGADNHVVISPQGLTAIRRLQALHLKYKDEELQHSSETKALNSLLAQSSRILDPKIFTTVMQSTDAAVAEKILVDNKATPLEVKNAIQLRSEYHARLAKKQAPGIAIAELYDDFLLESAQ